MRTNLFILSPKTQQNELAERTQIVCNDPEHCGIVNTSLVRSILVPFDNSAHAMRAFGHALDLAKKYGAKVTAVAVTDEKMRTDWVNDTPSRQRAISKTKNSELKNSFATLEGLATKFGIKFDSAILQSAKIAESIISFASMRKIDYIVMGTHGKGMPKEMMLGRVSTSVALNAHCPVVLIK